MNVELHEEDFASVLSKTFELTTFNKNSAPMNRKNVTSMEIS